MTPVDGCRRGGAERLDAPPPCATGSLDGPPAPQDLDRLAGLARRLLRTPAALVSLADGPQVVVGAHGPAPEPAAALRRSPFLRSIGERVTAGGAPLAIADARIHPLTCDIPTVHDPDVVACLGVPLRGPDGEVLGSLLVIDSTARDWSEDDIDALGDLGRAIAGLIAARRHRRERERAEAALLAGEARTTEILESIDAAFYAIDRDWRFLYANRHAERLWGRRREDILGRTMFELFPTFAGSESYRAHERAMAEGRPVRIETISAIFHAPVEIDIYASPSGLSVYFRDISDRKRIEEALRERDEALTLAERSAGIGVWDVDLATGTMRATPQFFRIHGLEPAHERVPIETTRALRHPEDADRVIQGFRDAVESGRDAYEMEYRIVRPDGELRWIFGRGRVVRDGSGRPIRYSGVDIDVTERRRMEEHQKLLVAELSHRVKNALATVQSIATQSLADGRPLAEAREAFLRRLHALAATHGLLTASEWRGANLATLVRNELSPYGGHASVAGEDLVLTPKAALTLGLVVHELATNAAKYGALGVPEGRIEVAWGVEQGGRFHLSWRERGGPKVRPPVRRGFGWTILERIVAHDLGGAASLEFAPEGLDYRLTAPLQEVVG